MQLPQSAATELGHILQSFHAAYAQVFMPTNDGKAFEALVMMRLAYNVQCLMPTWSVRLSRGDGTPLAAGTPFNFPAGKSGIRPANPHGPGYVDFQHVRYGDRRVEMHGSLQWRGRSMTRHEIDISVVPASIATALRAQGGGYPHGLPIAAIECKDKDGAGSIDEMREKLARMFDLALVTQPASGWSCRIFETKSFQPWGHRSSTYRGFFSKGTFALVRAGTFQPGAITLATHYHIRSCPDYYTDSFSINALAASFRTTLARISEF